MSATSFVQRFRFNNQLTLLLAAGILPALLVVFAIMAQSAVAESFCAVIAASIALPPLLGSMRRPAIRLIAAGLSTGISATLLLSMPISFLQWIGVVAIIGSISVFLAGAVAIVPSAFLTISAVLWLSWPIWLSERLAGHDRLVNLLASVHPLLAVNGQLLDQAIWTERPLMYGWTGLNQDVPFVIPTTVTWCVLLHGGIGLALVVISYRSWLIGTRRSR